MTTDQLRAAYQAEPFRPFVLHLADGGSIPVHRPEFLMIVPSGRTVVIVQPDDSLNIIDALLVTDIEFKPAAGGPARRKKA